MHIVRRAALWMTIVVAWSCASPTGVERSTTSGEVAAIAIDPPATVLLMGAELPLHARVQDATGTLLGDVPVTWTVRDTTIARVSASGVVSARSVGVTQVAANASGKSGLAAITVQQTPVASVTLQPSRVDLITGARTPLAAITYDAAKKILDKRVVLWSSSNPRVAAVDTAGVVTALAAGTATIAATSEGQSDAATIVVTDPPVATVTIEPATLALTVGQSAPLSPTTRDAGGSVLAGRTVEWTTSSAAVAAVTAQGAVSGVGVGTATITATSEGRTATATVTVVAVPIASIVVQPGAAGVAVGSTVALSAAAKDASGGILAGRALAWTSSDDRIAHVSANGVVTGVAPGSATITAAGEGKSGTAAVVVTSVPTASVIVAPAAVSIVTGGTVPLTASVLDAKGGALMDRGVTWTSSDARVATVSPTGLVTAVAPGAATIGATSEGKTGSAAVTVVQTAVGNVTLQPATISLTSGATATLTPTVRDVNGTVVTGRFVTWTSSNALVATISGEGVVKAVSRGTATITASSEGKSGTAEVSVADAPVASVVVVPSAASITAGQSVTLSVSITDVNGAPASDRAVSWTSSNAAVATVSQTGVVSAVGAGSATIMALSEGRSGSAAVTVTSVPVASIAVAPSVVNLRAGRAAPLTATVRGADGAVLADRPVLWSTSNGQIASVTNAGVVTAGAPGTATITATSEGKSASATVNVTAVPVGSVVVAPAGSDLTPGQATPLAATVRNEDGTIVTDRPVTWTSSDTAVAKVTAAGVVTAVGIGSATITAASEGVSGTATVRVAPVAVRDVAVSPATARLVTGQTTTLTATVTGANGAVLADRTVTWSTSDASVAAVSSTGAVGTVTAVGAGTATISATSGGKTGTASITIVRPAVKSVTIEPASATLPSGQVTRLTVTVRDANDAVVGDRVVTWTTSNAQVATVSDSGVATGVSAGTATITATSEGQSGSAAVTVTPTPVGSVAVVPATVSIEAGATASLTAQVRDANGVVVTDRVVTWTSSDATVARVSPAGVVSALAKGTATITAVSEGKPGSATVTVTVPAPVATVSVQPTTSNLTPGQTAALTATLADANGNVLSGRIVTWSSSDPGVATVSQSGVVTAVDAGGATISATSEGHSGGATVTVTVPVATITLKPTTLTIAPKQSEPLTATTTSANGTVLTGRLVTYTSSNTAVASVTSDGQVTGIASGTATITATSEGKSATAAVRVQPGPAAKIAMPTSLYLGRSTRVTLTATATDAFGNAIEGRAFTWTSSNTTVATVDQNGLVTAKKPGTVRITAAMDDQSAFTTVTVYDDGN